jgi:hypothetical protein
MVEKKESWSKQESRLKKREAMCMKKRWSTKDQQKKHG